MRSEGSRAVSGLFGKALWEQVGAELKGEAGRWWTANEDALANLAKTEAHAVFRALKSGDHEGAKLALARSMSQDDWKAYRDGTTAGLEDVARRRADLYRVITELGSRAARLVGAAALGAIGG